MKRLLGMIFFLAYIGHSNAATFEQAVETARETWWYFRKTMNAPHHEGYFFAVRMNGDNWYGLKENRSWGFRLTLNGEITQDSIAVDSANIIDWAFSEGRGIKGAFSLRVNKGDKSKGGLLAFMDDKLSNSAVGTDFIALSKWPSVNGHDVDTFPVYFMNSRFPGGNAAFYAHMGKYTHYPEFARELGLEGNCYIHFIVEPDGRITCVVKQSIGGGTKAEIQQVMSMLPSFKPDENAGRVRFTLPFRFVLQ